MRFSVNKATLMRRDEPLNFLGCQLSKQAIAAYVVPTLTVPWKTAPAIWDATMAVLTGQSAIFGKDNGTISMSWRISESGQARRGLLSHARYGPRIGFYFIICTSPQTLIA